MDSAACHQCVGIDDMHCRRATSNLSLTAHLLHYGYKCVVIYTGPDRSQDVGYGRAWDTAGCGIRQGVGYGRAWWVGRARGKAEGKYLHIFNKATSFGFIH